MVRNKRNPSVLGIHAGKLIAEKMTEQRISKAELTRRLKRNHQTLIALLLKRQSMQAYLLWELSIALEYDFFSAISEALLQKHPQVISANASGKATIAALEKELATVKEERDYLKKMINVLAK